MTRSFALAMVFALALALLLGAQARAEEADVELPRDEASLALDSPDVPDAELAEQIEDPEPRESLVPRETDGDAEVPVIDEDTYAAREGNEQIKLLKYHKQLIIDRDRTRASREESPHQFHFGLGAQLASFGGAGPNGEFQVTISNHFSLGAMIGMNSFTASSAVLGTTYTGAVGVLGFGGAVNYYSRRPYEGIWLQLGLGLDSFRVSTISGDTLSNEIPLFFSTGWRFLNDENNLTFGFGAGGRLYFFAAEPTFAFLIRLEIGLAWNVFPH